MKKLLFIIFSAITVVASAQPDKAAGVPAFNLKTTLDATIPNEQYGYEWAYCVEDSTVYVWSRTDSVWNRYSGNHVTEIAVSTDTSTITDIVIGDVAHIGSDTFYIRGPNGWLMIQSGSGLTGSGTTGNLVRWGPSSSLTDADITDNGTLINIGASRDEVTVEATDSVLVDGPVVNVGGQPSATIRVSDTDKTVTVQAGALEQKIVVDDFGVSMQIDGGNYYMPPGSPPVDGKYYVGSWFNGSPLWYNITDTMAANDTVTTLLQDSILVYSVAGVETGRDTISVAGKWYTSSGNYPHFMNGTTDWPLVRGSTESFTPGSLLFAGTSGQAQQDNASLFWDDTKNWLGIGTNTPIGRLSIRQDDVFGVNYTFYARNINTAGQTVFYLENNRGSFTSYGGFLYGGATQPTAGLFGAPSRQDRLFMFAGGASNLGMYVGTLSAQPLVFGTSNAERVRISSSGAVGIGLTNPSYLLDIGGSSAAFRITPRSTTPTLANGLMWADDNYDWLKASDGANSFFLAKTSVNGSTFTQGNIPFSDANGALDESANLVWDDANSELETTDIIVSEGIAIGVTSPTARLHLPAGTATASTAPFKFTLNGHVPLTTPEAGVLSPNAAFDRLSYTNNSAVRKELAFTDDINNIDTTDLNLTSTGNESWPLQFNLGGYDDGFEFRYDEGSDSDNGDRVGSIQWRPRYNGSIQNEVAAITGIYDGNGTTRKGRLHFVTHNGSGLIKVADLSNDSTIINADYTRFSNGSVGINILGAPTAQLEVNGTTKVTGVSTFQAAVNMTGTSALQIHTGTTAQRPGSPVQGQTRANTDNDTFEGYDGTKWKALDNKPYTPTSTADSYGSEGDITYDDDHIYIKTSAGWKRSALSTF